jgi:hypothetical protein
MGIINKAKRTKYRMHQWRNAIDFAKNENLCVGGDRFK